MSRARDLGSLINSTAAGRNKIINGDFGIWQRGSSFASGTTSTFTADRWFIERYSGTFSVSRQTFTPGSAPVAGYEGQYFLRLSVSSAGDIGIRQAIEDVRTFAGQTVTVSFWAKASVSMNLQYVLLLQRYGTGGSSETGKTVASNQAITTSWQRYSFTTTMDSVSGKTIGANSALSIRIDPSESFTGDLDIWGVQLEAGSTATPFSLAGGDVQGELAKCQRYFYRAQSSSIAIGSNNSTNGRLFMAPLPTPMRSTPAITKSGNLSVYDGGLSNYQSNPGFSNIYYPANSSTVKFDIPLASSPTNNTVLIFGTQQGVNDYVDFAAEL